MRAATDPDGGATWAYIAIPLLPDQQPGSAVGIGTDGVTVTPGGGLLATGQQQSGNDWLLLKPGTDAWCPVTTPGTGTAGTATSTVATIGNELWWLTYTDTGIATPHNVDIARLDC